MNSRIGTARRKSELTSKRILDVARGLFNDHGTSAVSTNHIAAGAGISPGNLYYHFENKKDIIRALLAEYTAAYEDRWAPSADAGENLATLGENLAAWSELAWEYRFFEREVLALLRVDPALRDSYRETYERRVGQYVAFGEQLAAQGLLRAPAPPRTLHDLAVAIWLIGQGWLPFLDVSGDPRDPRQVARGTDLVLVALAPHLTTKGRRALENVAPRAGARVKRVDRKRRPEEES